MSMKQQIVIKLLNTDQKGKSKAMKKVGGIRGVSSTSLAGEGQSLLIVIAEGVDSVKLMRLLRKKIGSTELLSVSPAREKELGKMDYGNDSYYHQKNGYDSYYNQKEGYEPYYPKNGYEPYGYSPYTRPNMNWTYQENMTPYPMTPHVYEIRHVESPGFCSIM